MYLNVESTQSVEIHPVHCIELHLVSFGIVSLIHQNKGGIGKSILDALQIFLNSTLQILLGHLLQEIFWPSVKEIQEYDRYICVKIFAS